MSVPCTRFEHEGLPAWERGEALDPHFDACPDCLAARKAYEATVQKIESVEIPPLRAEWRERLWGAIERPSRWRRWFQVAGSPPRWITGGAIAAVLIVAVVLPFAMNSNGDAALHWRAVSNPDAEPYRGDFVPGDILTLEATVGGARFSELRVYYNRDELIFRCSGAPECVRSGDGLTASVTLPRRGTYHPVLLVSPEPLPEPSRGRDEDLADALQRGATVHSTNASAGSTVSSIEVR